MFDACACVCACASAACAYARWFQVCLCADGKSCELQAQHALCVVRSHTGLAKHAAEHHMHILTGATDAGGKGRGSYAGEKRPRNLERLTAAAAQSAVDMSLEHEYSD